ncbi:dephospho-CoA kinase [Pannonibacter phragmitetus]|uniref:Dephospho-CoA kinase n=1 Tax=Pannonibacter phragmitetus TaxID=121719 RepID=A0A0U2W2I8_9HYPH|nr:dephospho-CoA kinase [Pannonibacter phragmitetus]ALV26778.1 dephospho-CoA kinase [Pannonibacter phragmitetus]
MIRLGLTGSIAMGKSATAKMFAEAGVPVHDADAAVHALYAGRAVPLIEAAFPGTTADGKVDRTRLGEAVLGKPEAIARLEAIIHPLVHEAEADFLARARAEGRRMVVLDIPLLFETGGERRMDAVVVVSAPVEVQRERALARPGMTVQRLDAILARQMPDADKRRRSHFIIETGSGLDPARRAVRSIIRALSGKA